MGVGPAYVIIIVALTICGVILKSIGFFKTGSLAVLELPFFVLGILLIAAGCFLWLKANLQSKLSENIKQNKLLTTGVYAYMRNPVYTGFMLMCTGILLLMNNLWLLILPVVFWAFLSILLINTEEKWLKERFGQEYINYCRKVNRCIPFKK